MNALFRNLTALIFFIFSNKKNTDYLSKRRGSGEKCTVWQLPGVRDEYSFFAICISVLLYLIIPFFCMFLMPFVCRPKLPDVISCIRDCREYGFRYILRMSSYYTFFDVL